MEDLVKTAADKLEAAIRIVLPALFVLAALAYAGRFPLIQANIGERDAHWVALVVLIGSALYFLHKCCAENLLFRLVWFAFEEVHRLNSDENCQKRDGHRLTFAEWRNLLHQERWARLVTENQIAKAHQDKLNGLYDWLSAGYCSAYGLMITSAFVPWRPVFPWNDISASGAAFPPTISWVFLALGAVEPMPFSLTPPGPFIFAIGFIALGIALIGDFRVTEIEWWLNHRFPQLQEPEKVATALPPQPITVSPDIVFSCEYPMGVTVSTVNSSAGE